MKRAMIFETAMTELASLLKDCKFDAAINRAQFLFARACAALSCKSYKAKVIADIIKQFDIEDDNLSVGHLLWILKRDVMSMDHISEAVKDALKNTKFSSAAIALTPRPITASAEKDDMLDNVGVRGADASVSIMSELGWHVGCAVHQKREKDEDDPILKYTIVEIKDGNVKMHAADNDTDDSKADDANKKDLVTKTVCISEFQDKMWVKVKTVESVVIPPSVPTAESSKEFQLELVKSVAFLAIAEAITKQEGADNLQARLKPKRSVEVVADIAKGKLVLAPCTTHVQVLEKDKLKAGYNTFNKASLLLGSFTHESQQYYIFASGYQSVEAAGKRGAKRALFWGVETTDDESAANVKFDKSIDNQKIHPGKINQWMANQIDTQQVIKIPMLVSTKALKAGDSLALYQPAAKRQRTK